jgi:hypothetical protein
MVVNNIIYTSRIIPPYKSHMKSLQNIITAFIKYEKPQVYSNNDIKKAPTQGGFGLPDLETKIQTFHNMWLHYAKKTKENAVWIELFNNQISTTPKQGQNSIFHNILSTKNKQKFDWNSIQSKLLYQELIKAKQKPYNIELTLANTFNWGQIWLRWYHRNINNKIKIQIHRVLSDKLTEEIITNKSGNCCLCDHPFIQSKDHIFFNCRGISDLKEKMFARYDIEIDQNILYENYKDQNEGKYSYIYMYTIIKVREIKRGKWGALSQRELTCLFDNHLKWL